MRHVLYFFISDVRLSYFYVLFLGIHPFIHSFIHMFRSSLTISPSLVLEPFIAKTELYVDGDVLNDQAFPIPAFIILQTRDPICT